eukprot:11883255-Alexandrium_andersonii.AAC.1
MRLCVVPLAREILALPGAEVAGPEVSEAGPSAVLRSECAVFRIVLYRDGVVPAGWVRAQRRANAAALGHLPRAGTME